MNHPRLTRAPSLPPDPPSLRLQGQSRRGPSVDAAINRRDKARAKKNERKAGQHDKHPTTKSVAHSTKRTTKAAAQSEATGTSIEAAIP